MPIDRERESGRLERFEEVLYGSKGVNVPELRKLSWSGIPPKLRADTWRTLNVSICFIYCVDSYVSQFTVETYCFAAGRCLFKQPQSVIYNWNQ